MKKLFTLAYLLLSVFFGAIAQPGTINTSFGRPVINIGDSTRFFGYVSNIIEQPDQRFLVGHFDADYNGISSLGILRFLEDVTLDTSFNTFWTFGTSTFSLLQPDGKVLVGGTFSASQVNEVIRLMPNGSLDTTFNTGTGFSNSPSLASL